MPVEKTDLLFNQLPDDGKTYMLTNGTNEILSTEGGGTNKGIKELDLGVFTDYADKTKPDGMISHTAIDLTKFTVLHDSEVTSNTYDKVMKQTMIPIISALPSSKGVWKSAEGQVLTPKIDTPGTIGNKQKYFAGSVIKAMSNPTNDKFLGVYHIKAIDYTKVKRHTPYPGISRDNVVQGYRLFVDYYISIIADFLKSDANTLYLAQFPGQNFGSHASHFYAFLLHIIYTVLKLRLPPDVPKTIMFNLVKIDDSNINNEAEIWLNNGSEAPAFDKIYDKISNETKNDDISKGNDGSDMDWYKRNLQLKDDDEGAGGDDIQLNGNVLKGYFYKKILPYITEQIATVFGGKGGLPDGATTVKRNVTPIVPQGESDQKRYPDITKVPIQGEVIDQAVIDKTPPGPNINPVEGVPIEQEPMYVTFYNTMENWINDATLAKMFDGRQIVTTDIWLNDLYGTNDNRSKIKMIFDYLRDLNKPVKRGGGSLEDFKNYIREQIRKIKISQ
jgi:hypothetical protein